MDLADIFGQIRDRFDSGTKHQIALTDERMSGLKGDLVSQHDLLIVMNQNQLTISGQLDNAEKEIAAMQKTLFEALAEQRLALEKSDQLADGRRDEIIAWSGSRQKDLQERLQTSIVAAEDRLHTNLARTQGHVDLARADIHELRMYLEKAHAFHNQNQDSSSGWKTAMFLVIFLNLFASACMLYFITNGHA